MAQAVDETWHLTDEGKVLCAGQVSKALHLDFKEHAAPCLPENVTLVKLGTFKADVVLQVTKVRNVSAPKTNEESGTAPRMLKISMTDGQNVCHGLETSRLDGISVNTPPGSKVKLVGNVAVSPTGFLLLHCGSLTFLGGKVVGITDKWEVQRKMVHFTRATARSSSSQQQQNGGDGEGPPAWIPFGKKIKSEAATAKTAKENSSNANKEEKNNDEFDSQRQDAIKEASSKDGYGSKKVFGGGGGSGGGTKELKETTTSGGANEQQQDDGAKVSRRGGGGGGGGRESNNEKVDETNDADGRKGRTRRERGRGGGGRSGRGGRGTATTTTNTNDSPNNGIDYGHQNKPAAGVKLFDFLGEKFPDAEEPSKSKDVQNNRKSERPQQQQQPSRRQRSNNEKGRTNSTAESSGGSGRREQRNKEESRQQQKGSGGGRRNLHHQQESSRNNSKKELPAAAAADQKHASTSSGRTDGGKSRGSNNSARQHRDAAASGRPGASDRDFGEWSNSTYHNAAASQRLDHHRQQQQQQRHNAPSASNLQQVQQKQQLIESLKAMNVSGGANRRPNDVVAEDLGDVYQPDFNTDHRQPPPPPPLLRWKVGDECLAKYWEDDHYYPVKLTALSKQNTAVVFFKDYGNYEEVLLQDVYPFPQGAGHERLHLQGLSAQQVGGFIPTTPGLPPAFPPNY